MKISVIIPAYKPQHLLDALSSVFAQSYADYEVIVVNDGSPFEIRNILLPFIDSGRIVYIEQENRGTAAARNRGLAEAKGEFVALLDDDDYWPEDKLRWQALYLEDHQDIGVIVGHMIIVDNAGSVKWEPPMREGPVTFEDVFSCAWTPGQTLIRKTVIAERQGFDETIWGADDYDLWLSLARSTSIMAVPRLALYYRTHESNASRNALGMCLNIQRSLQKHLQLANPRSRTVLRLEATRFLYAYIGGIIIREWKSRILRKEWSKSGKYFRAIAWMIRGALPAPVFLASIFLEILPARFMVKHR